MRHHSITICISNHNNRNLHHLRQDEWLKDVKRNLLSWQKQAKEAFCLLFCGNRNTKSQWSTVPNTYNSPYWEGFRLMILMWQDQNYSTIRVCSFGVDLYNIKFLLLMDCPLCGKTPIIKPANSSKHTNTSIIIFSFVRTATKSVKARTSIETTLIFHCWHPQCIIELIQSKYPQKCESEAVIVSKATLWACLWNGSKGCSVELFSTLNLSYRKKWTRLSCDRRYWCL